MGLKYAPIPNAKLKFFFPIQKDFSKSYNCSALIIAPENKIFMIKKKAWEKGFKYTVKLYS